MYRGYTQEPLPPALIAVLLLLVLVAYVLWTCRASLVIPQTSENIQWNCDSSPILLTSNQPSTTMRSLSEGTHDFTSPKARPAKGEPRGAESLPSAREIHRQRRCIAAPQSQGRSRCSCCSWPMDGRTDGRTPEHAQTGGDSGGDHWLQPCLGQRHLASCLYRSVLPDILHHSLFHISCSKDGLAVESAL